MRSYLVTGWVHGGCPHREVLKFEAFPRANPGASQLVLPALPPLRCVGPTLNPAGPALLPLSPFRPPRQCLTPTWQPAPSVHVLPFPRPHASAAARSTPVLLAVPSPGPPSPLSVPVPEPQAALPGDTRPRPSCPSSPHSLLREHEVKNVWLLRKPQL